MTATGKVPRTAPFEKKTTQDRPANTCKPLLFKLQTSLETDARQYWSHKLYRGPNGQNVALRYCKTRAESEAAAQSLLGQDVLGFDMEWKPFGPKRLGEFISVIQLACEEQIVLFHLALHEGNTAVELIAPTLRKIIESPLITKTGVAILNADAKRLKTYLGLRARGLLELSHLHKVVKYSAKEPDKVNKGLVALADLTKEHLRMPLWKGKVRVSNWSKPLNQAQIDYAAADAYVGYMLFRVLEEKRMKLDPMPPRPAHADLYAPIYLANGVIAGKAVDMEEPSGANGPEKPAAVQKSRDISKSDELDAVSSVVFQALRSHRRGICSETNLIAYQVATDNTLKSIAKARPNDLEGLRQIRGIGKVKIDLYGSQWLSIIQQYALTICPTSAAVASLDPDAQRRHGKKRKSQEYESEEVSDDEFSDASDPLDIVLEGTNENDPSSSDSRDDSSSSSGFESLPSLEEIIREVDVKRHSVFTPRATRAGSDSAPPDPPSSPPVLQSPCILTKPPQPVTFPEAQPSQPPKPSKRRLHSALLALRRRIHLMTQLPESAIATTDALTTLASHRPIPTTISELRRIDGLAKLIELTTSRNINLLEFLRKHCPQAQQPQIQAATTPQRKAPDINTAMQSHKAIPQQPARSSMTSPSVACTEAIPQNAAKVIRYPDLALPERVTARLPAVQKRRL